MKIASKIIALSMLFSLQFVRAQNANDVFWYNDTELNGTARFMGTAGTISTLGSDLSAISVNPAGATAFLANRISWTPGFYSLNNTLRYGQNTDLTEDKNIYHNVFNTNHFGFVMPYVSTTSEWNKLAFGITYGINRLYANNFKAEGNGYTMQSLADYFVNEAQGVPTGDLKVGLLETTDGVYSWLGENYGSYAQHAFLAYQGYVINPVSNSDNNTDYVSNASFAQPLHRLFKQRNAGKKTEFQFFFAGEYKHKLSLGVSFTQTGMDMTRQRSIAEDGYDNNSTLQYAAYSTWLRTKATGYRLKLGMIFKPLKPLRLSLAYQTPVWWKMSESLQESLYSKARDIDDLDNDGNTTEINVFDLQPAQINNFSPYRYIEPGKWSAGLAYIVGKNGFLSVNYSYRNWAGTHFAALDNDAQTADYYDALNDQIKQVFTATQRVAVGGEFRVDAFSLRGGYFVQTSPYRDFRNQVFVKGMTFGMGYDFGNVELDFGLINAHKKFYQQFLSNGLTESFSVNKTRNAYALTLRVNL